MKFPLVLYHGTSTAYLHQILREGLNPKCSYRGYLCYADDIEIARHHAECIADFDAGDFPAARPAVFTLATKRFTRSAFCLDGGFVTLGASAGRAFDMKFEGTSWTWQALLAVAGSVGYRKLLKVTQADVALCAGG